MVSKAKEVETKMKKSKRKSKNKTKEAQNAKLVRWKAFADFLAQGKSATEAYRLAGYSRGNDHSDGANAARLLRNAQVLELVKAARDEASSKRMATAVELKEFYTKTMRGEVNDVKETEEGIITVPPKLADRIRAADSLGKCFGLFTEKTDGKLVVTIRRGGDSAASLQKRGTE